MIHLTTLSSQLVLPSTSAWVAVSVPVALVLYIYVRGPKLLVQLPSPPGGKWTTGEHFSACSVTNPIPSFSNQGHFKSIMGVDGVKFQENLVATYGPTMKLNGAFGVGKHVAELRYNATYELTCVLCSKNFFTRLILHVCMRSW